MANGGDGDRAAAVERHPGFAIFKTSICTTSAVVPNPGPFTREARRPAIESAPRHGLTRRQNGWIWGCGISKASFVRTRDHGRRLQQSLYQRQETFVFIHPYPGNGRLGRFLIDTRGGQTRTSPFHYQDGSYRFEVVEDGQTRIITVDGASGVMHVLVPSEKVYFEAFFHEELSRVINPFSAFRYYRQTEDAKVEGTESIGGLACTKVVVSREGQVIVTGWLSKGIGCPLKVDTPVDARTVELRNIKHGPQDAALFAVPAGYAPAKPKP